MQKVSVFRSEKEIKKTVLLSLCLSEKRKKRVKSLISLYLHFLSIYRSICLSCCLYVCLFVYLCPIKICIRIKFQAVSLLGHERDLISHSANQIKSESIISI